MGNKPVHHSRPAIVAASVPTGPVISAHTIGAMSADPNSNVDLGAIQTPVTVIKVPESTKNAIKMSMDVA